LRPQLVRQGMYNTGPKRMISIPLVYKRLDLSFQELDSRAMFLFFFFPYDDLNDWHGNFFRRVDLTLDNFSAFRIYHRMVVCNTFALSLHFDTSLGGWLLSYTNFHLWKLAFSSSILYDVVQVTNFCLGSSPGGFD
jgi:hypothetical protein